MSADLMRPSLSLVCEKSVLIAMPSKSRLVMKLIAPEMASEPYTADAPPVMMSMRSMSAVGMVCVSTAPPMPNGVRRLPSSMTRLRFEPRPRRLMVAAPPVPLLTFWPSDGKVIGRSRKIFSTSGCCSWSMSSAPSETTGLEEVRPGVVMRVPVTTTSSRPCSGCCAWAKGPDTANGIAALNSAIRTASFTEERFVIDCSPWRVGIKTRVTEAAP